MSLFVDTSVWSLAFRRDPIPSAPEVQVLRDALEGGDTVLITGLILQELLQGFAGARASKDIITRFAALPLLPPDRQDHIEAAELRNRCRRAGLQIGTIVAVLAQLCIRHRPPLALDRLRELDPERLAYDPSKRGPGGSGPLLLARIYEVFPLVCPHCDSAMRITAFITDGPAVRDILVHLGEPITPPTVAPARGPGLPRNAEKHPHGDAQPRHHPVGSPASTRDTLP